MQDTRGTTQFTLRFDRAVINDEEKLKRTLAVIQERKHSLGATRERAAITTIHRGVSLQRSRRRIQYVPRPRQSSNEITFPLCLFSFACESHASRFVPNLGSLPCRLGGASVVAQPLSTRRFREAGQKVPVSTGHWP